MKKKLQILFGVLALSTVQLASAQSVSPALQHSLSQTLSTDAYVGILKAMVDPKTLSTPTAICAECHGGEDMARYQHSIGPMMQMVDPSTWINPMAYLRMASPVVDPETYKQWYDGWMNKYGSLLGAGSNGDTTEQPASE